MIRIFAADLLVADRIAALNPALSALAEQYGLRPGGKTPLAPAGADAFAKAFAGCEKTVPGGSSANTLATLARLLPGETAITFLTAGEGVPRQALEAAGITVIGPATAQTATSYVTVWPGGQRAIATWRGNVREVLTPDLITGAMVENADVLFVQGSLWDKLDPAFADKLVELATHHGKKLWLTLPTRPALSAQEQRQFLGLISRADIVLGNDEELSRVYDLPPDAALEKLKDECRLALITCAGRGAVAVSGGKLLSFNAPGVTPERIVSTLGAGDTAYAGFLAGHMKGLPVARCGEIAMRLAAEKLKTTEARLPDPLAVLGGKIF